MFLSAQSTLSRSRRLLLLACLLFFGGCMLVLWHVEIGENAAAMLPDSGPVARDFRLLQLAPFAQRLAISLEDKGGLGPDALTTAARELAEELRAVGPPLIRDALAGPSEAARDFGPQLFVNLLRRLPSLASAQDREAIRERLSAEALTLAMRKNLQLLQAPQGFLVEPLVRLDPLELRDIALDKLAAVRLLPHMRLHNGAFLSRDLRHALVLAETDVSVTDIKGSKRLLERVERIMMRSLPPDIEPSLLCGHAYTRANAEAVRLDMARILSISILGLGLLFGVTVRTWRVLFVLLVPGMAYLAGAAATATFYPVVSGITLGFGGVLMGISADFALHVFMALRYGRDKPGNLLAGVARPIIFSFFTTAAAFSIMLLSGLPGVRQLSVFSLAGLSAALCAALFLLPQLPLGTRPHNMPPTQHHRPLPLRWDFGRQHPRSILVCWLLLLLGCVLAGRHLHLESDLRKLALMPEPLVQAEQDFKRDWGDVRSQAMVFAFGESLQQALAVNESAYEQLRGILPSGQSLRQVLSLAPLLPPDSTQQQRRKAWTEFWAEELPRARPLLLGTARDLGFSTSAFDPFFQLLQQDLAAPEVALNPHALRDMGLGPILDMLAKGSEDGFQVITLLPDDPLILQKTPPAWSNEEEGPLRLVSQTGFRQAMEQALHYDFTRFLLLAGAAVFLLLLIMFRRPVKVCLALVPVLTALAMLMGGKGLLTHFGGTGLTIYGVLAAVLCMGLAVDYGIFMTLRPERAHDNITDRAVLLSGLSTILGFGSLAVAQHPALHGMGLAVLLGLAGALPAALFVIPALQALLRRGSG